MIRCPATRIVQTTYRCLSTTSILGKQSTKSEFGTGPAPPRLPPKEQEEFERLQKMSTGAFSTPKISDNSDQELEGTQISVTATSSIRVEAKGDGQELHPDIRRGAKPEFEGERNPVTGEIGGPKTEPIRWGSNGERGDWSYNGRVTDF